MALREMLPGQPARQLVLRVKSVESVLMETIVVEPMLEGPALEARIELPPGWYRVLSGAIKPRDRYLAADYFWEDGEIHWCEVTRLPRPGEPLSTADWYLCLIRRGEPVEVLCPRCRRKPARLGYRYCRDCCGEVILQLRRRRRRLRGKGNRKA